MKTFQCAQRGCEFEAASAPDDCPVCNNPFFATDAAAKGNGEDEYTWGDYTKPELKEQLKEWEVTGWNWATNKAGLIALLEAAEQEVDPDA